MQTIARFFASVRAAPATRRAAAALAVALALGAAASARADAHVHSLFTEHAVLQQGMPVPVWGTADTGEVVTVEFQGQTRTVAANPRGRWRVVLDPLQPGGPFPLTIRGATNTIARADILVGEVWVCSGQSNMGWGLGNSETTNAIATFGDDPMLRLVHVPWDSTEMPKAEPGTEWLPSTPWSAYSFPAVGYYFGRDLRRALNVPVGLISSCIGGSFAHTWIPARYLSTTPELKSLMAYWGEHAARIEEATLAFEQQEQELWKQYEAAVAEAARTGAKPPLKPAPPAALDFDDRNRTAGIYNGMIAPLQPFAIRGLLWYQGENDAGNPTRYRTTLSTLIRAWRETWGQGDFPFMVVQLPAIGIITNVPTDTMWATMRETQRWVAQNVSNVMSVTSIDCGNPENTQDLHPPNKLPIGQRLALTARARVYGQDVEYSGPVFEAMTVEGNRATLSFTHVTGGLVAKGGGDLTGFTIAGEDKTFANAQATIDGNRVVVWSDAVAAPVAVRYAWADYPVCNLSNTADIPAGPFRTDDWPLKPDEWR